MNETRLSTTIKQLRKEYNLTQQDLAYKSGVGLRFVRELEQGKPTVRMDKVNQVLELFNLQLGPVPMERRTDKWNRDVYFHKNAGVELDFLMRYKGQCTPVECKATTGNAKSMRTVMSHPEKYHVSSAIKLGDYNIGRKDQLLTLPLYMAFLLKEV